MSEGGVHPEEQVIKVADSDNLASLLTLGARGVHEAERGIAFTKPFDFSNVYLKLVEKRLIKLVNGGFEHHLEKGVTNTFGLRPLVGIQGGGQGGVFGGRCIEEATPHIPQVDAIEPGGARL